MSEKENTIIEEREVAPTRFNSVDKLIDALDTEIGMLKEFESTAAGLKKNYEPGQAEFEWFEAWVERLEDLRQQAEHWAACLRNGDNKSVIIELEDEKKILSGLIGLTHTALMAGVDKDETDFLVRAYRQDFRRTRKNIVNALESIPSG